MKEKIFKILKKYEDIELAYQYDVATEEEALKNKATPENIADEILELVNQEVENRIAERMPSPSDKLKGLREYQFSIRGRHEKDYITEDFLEGVEWLRSRLSQKTDNLKENNNNGSTN